jgi:hypothetical protein
MFSFLYCFTATFGLTISIFISCFSNKITHLASLFWSLKIKSLEMSARHFSIDACTLSDDVPHLLFALPCYSSRGIRPRPSRVVLLHQWAWTLMRDLLVESIW